MGGQDLQEWGSVKSCMWGGKVYSRGWKLESSSPGKGLGVLVDTRLTLSSNMTLGQRRSMVYGAMSGGVSPEA